MIKLIFQIKFQIFRIKKKKYQFFLGDLGKFWLKTLTSGTIC